MKIKNKPLFGLFCFLSITFAACEAKEPVTKSPYPIVDSGVWADPSNPYIYWIDNNRILFKTVKDNNKHLTYQGPFNLSIWEIGKGVTAYTPFAHGVSACLRDGIFRYSLEDEEKNIKVFYGKFGEEKLVSPPKILYPTDLVNCRITDNPEIVARRQNNRAIRPLLDRHGYLDIGAIRGKESLKETQAVFYRPGRDEGITLPIHVAGLVNYYSFKDAYFIKRGLGLYQYIDKPGKAWWLTPEGTVTEIVVPRNPLNKYYVIPFPIKIGIFAVSHSSKSVKEPGLAGGYFLRDGKWSKVLDGDIRGPDVSPDGCKVAFSHAPYLDADLFNDPARRTLKLINFCTEEKNHGK